MRAYGIYNIFFSIFHHLDINLIVFFLGGRDLSGNKRESEQSFDQSLTKSNKAIAMSCKANFNDKVGADAGEKWREGKPVRVVRGWKGRKHSKYAPEAGKLQFFFTF